MEIDTELPPDLEWYKDQIAGHHPSIIRNGLRQIDKIPGILKERGRNKLILKLAQDGVRGEREVALYRRIEAVNVNNQTEVAANIKILLSELYTFVPRFYGCRQIKLSQKGLGLLPHCIQRCDLKLEYSDNQKEFLQLEDITHPFSKPCIMDIKVGRVTYDPFASEEKKRGEELKCPSQKMFGFRILGYRVHTETETRSRDRVWGRERTEGNIQQAFEEYLVQALPEVAFHVLDAFIERLTTIQRWFERQGILHFYASSVLLVYEGHSKLAPMVDIRMIDFSHVFPIDGASQRDENYLYGLVRIVEIFCKIRKELSDRMANGQTAVDHRKN